MKLYTEEQVRSLLNKMDIIYSLEDLTPIELPSDEEIDELLERKSSVNLLGFITGVKWMKEQILNQNK
jgi:hypothetical protein